MSRHYDHYFTPVRDHDRDHGHDPDHVHDPDHDHARNHHNPDRDRKQN